MLDKTHTDQTIEEIAKAFVAELCRLTPPAQDNCISRAITLLLDKRKYLLKEVEVAIENLQIENEMLANSLSKLVDAHNSIQR